MTRLKLLTSLSQFLKGVARIARVDLDVPDLSLALYLREYIRHQLKDHTDRFDLALINTLHGQVIETGNVILRQLGNRSEDQPDAITTRMGTAILEEQIIFKQSFEEYCRSSQLPALTFNDIREYNHAVLLKVVAMTFLEAIDPANLKEILELHLEMSTRPGKKFKALIQVVNVGWTIKDRLKALGLTLYYGRATNFSEIDYFHYSRIPNTSYPINVERTGLPKLVSAKKPDDAARV